MEKLKTCLEEQINNYQELINMGEGAHNSSDMVEFETYLSAYQNILERL